MRVAGRDGTKLFCEFLFFRIDYMTENALALTHAWVNADFMLDACLVGFLVPEPSS